jgi:hypothetical protein
LLTEEIKMKTEKHQETPTIKEETPSNNKDTNKNNSEIECPKAGSVNKL